MENKNLNTWGPILKSFGISVSILEIVAKYCDKHSKIEASQGINSSSESTMLPLALKIFKKLPKNEKIIQSIQFKELIMYIDMKYLITGLGIVVSGSLWNKTVETNNNYYNKILLSILLSNSHISLFCSQLKKLRPVCLQATAVVPLPANGSKITSPTLLDN